MNNQGNPLPRSEYGSVLLTVDHLSAVAGQNLQKAVFASQDLTEAVIALLNYYGCGEYLHRSSTINLFQEASKQAHPAFIFRTPRNTVEIVMDFSTWLLLIERFDSVAEAHRQILDMAGEIIQNYEKSAGGLIPLQLFAFTQEPLPEPAPENTDEAEG